MRSEVLSLWTSAAVAWSGVLLRECGTQMMTAVSEGLKTLFFHTSGPSWNVGAFNKNLHLYLWQRKGQSYVLSQLFNNKRCFFSTITLRVTIVWICCSLSESFKIYPRPIWIRIQLYESFFFSSIMVRLPLVWIHFCRSQSSSFFTIRVHPSLGSISTFLSLSSSLSQDTP